MGRITLEAKEGYVFNNGGKTIYLAIGANPDDYYQITEEEYNEILNIENDDISLNQ